MTDILRLQDEFHAVHGWRYKYVARTWWVWDGRQWSHLDALQRMRQALIGIAGYLFPADHKAHRQLIQDYMIRNLEMRMRANSRADVLLGDPKLERGASTPGSRRPSELPAPADPQIQDQTPGSGPLTAAPSLESAAPAGTGETAGHTP
jgi:hypothetical protein